MLPVVRPRVPYAVPQRVAVRNHGHIVVPASEHSTAWDSTTQSATPHFRQQDRAGVSMATPSRRRWLVAMYIRPSHWHLYGPAPSTAAANDSVEVWQLGSKVDDACTSPTPSGRRCLPARRAGRPSHNILLQTQQPKFQSRARAQALRYTWLHENPCRRGVHGLGLRRAPLNNVNVVLSKGTPPRSPAPPPTCAARLLEASTKRSQMSDRGHGTGAHSPAT